MTSVSIAMAAYNGARYIRQQLDSFAAQTRLPEELIVCDDRSTDDTVRIVEDFARTAPFTVRVERNEKNLGYNQNFSRALSLCTGDIVFISDQDDFWFPSKLDRIVTLMGQHPDSLVMVADHVIGDAVLRDTGHTNLRDNAAIGRPDEACAWGCAMAMRREFLDLALPVPRDALDYDAWLNYLAVTLGVRSTTHESLQIHRRHDSNVSNAARASAGFATPRDSLKRKMLTNARSEWPVLMRQNEIFAARLEERSEWLRDHGLAERAGTAVAELRARTGILSRRYRTISRLVPLRAASIVGMLFHGDYRQFSGWKSAVRDLVR